MSEPLVSTHICVCREDIEQHEYRGRYLMCPDMIHEFTPRTWENYASRGRCASCGEPLYGELAETARGVIHQPCMMEGEQLA